MRQGITSSGVRFDLDGRAPYRVERLKSGAAIVLDADGINRVSFPDKPGAVFFGSAADADEAAALANA